MHYLPRKECNKVIAININWLLFSGSVLVILALVIYSNLFGALFNRLSCQVCLLLASAVLVIHSVHFWLGKWLIFICHLFYDSLYLLVALFMVHPTHLKIVYGWVLFAYLLLGGVRLYSFYRIRCGLTNVDGGPAKHESGGLIGRHDRTLKRAWHAMLWCGLLDFTLVVVMLCWPITEDHLLTIVSTDMLVSGLVFFRLGLVL